ncbi:MAG: hypothetical protein RR359_01285 [Bacilli bacterium]
MKLKLLIILFLSIFITSCNNIKELNNISLIKHIGISKINNNYKITFNIEEIKEKEKITNSYTFMGKNLETTYNEINHSIDKRLYLAHLTTLIISKDLLKEDYSNIINLLIKDKENRLDFSIFTLDNELFDKSMEYLKDNNSFNSLANNSNYFTSSVSNIRFDKLLNYYYENLDFVIPEITKVDFLKLDNYIYFKNNIYFNKLSTKESIIYNYLNDLIKELKYDKVYILENKSIIKWDKKSINIRINSKIQNTSLENIKNYKHKLTKELKIFINKYLPHIKKVKCKITITGDNYE